MTEPRDEPVALTSLDALGVVVRELTAPHFYPSRAILDGILAALDAGRVPGYGRTAGECHDEELWADALVGALLTTRYLRHAIHQRRSTP